jgi:hypothetical protein
MFGWKMVKRQHTELVLTASELDAMLITQQTGAAALALPRGDTTLPHKVRPRVKVTITNVRRQLCMVCYEAGDVSCADIALLGAV